MDPSHRNRIRRHNTPRLGFRGAQEFRPEMTAVACSVEPQVRSPSSPDSSPDRPRQSKQALGSADCNASTLAKRLDASSPSHVHSIVPDSPLENECRAAQLQNFTRNCLRILSKCVATPSLPADLPAGELGQPDGMLPKRFSKLLKLPVSAS